jgi:hypothetical protein
VARFDSAISLAQQLIKKNGQQVILRKVLVATPADPSKPWHTGLNTNTDSSVTGVFFDEKDGYKQGAEVVRKSTKICYIAGGAVSVPDIDDFLVQGAQSWKIQNIETLAPNGQDILYKLYLG